MKNILSLFPNELKNNYLVERPEQAGGTISVERDLGDLEARLARARLLLRPSRAFVWELVPEGERHSHHVAAMSPQRRGNALGPPGNDGIKRGTRQWLAARIAGCGKDATVLVCNPDPGHFLPALQAGRRDQRRQGCPVRGAGSPDGDLESRHELPGLAGQVVEDEWTYDETERVDGICKK